MKALCVFSELEEKEFKEKYKLSIQGLLSKPHQSFQYYKQKNFSLGFIKTVTTESVDKTVFRSENKTIILLGYPISLNSDINSLLNKAIQYETKRIISLLSSELDGAFSVILLEENTADVIVITDPLGLFPIYISDPVYKKKFVISTEIKGISKLFEKPELSIEGFVSWARSGSTYGEQTLVEGIKRLSGGSVYKISLSNKSYSNQTYWSQKRFSKLSNRNELLDELFHSFTEEVECYSRLSDNTIMTLSGGYDSRLIAAVLHSLNKSINSVSLDHFDEAGNLDGYLASKIAKELSFSHKSIKQDNKFYSFSNYLEFMKDSELSVPSDAIFIASITRILSSSFDGVWDGLAPGYAFKQDNRCWKNIDEYLQDGVVGNLKYELGDLRNLFRRDVAEQLSEKWSNFVPELNEKYGNDKLAVLDFIDDGRFRHRISIMPMKLVANYSAPLTPGLGKKFRNLIGNIPDNPTSSEGMYETLYKRYFPSLTRYPVISGGKVFYLRTPLGMTYLQTKIREKILSNWRVKSLLNRTLKPSDDSSHIKLISDNKDSIDRAIECCGLRGDILDKDMYEKKPGSELLAKLSYAFIKTF